MPVQLIIMSTGNWPMVVFSGILHLLIESAAIQGTDKLLISLKEWTSSFEVTEILFYGESFRYCPWNGLNLSS